MDRFTLYLGLAFIAGGELGQALHHWRIEPFTPDTVGEWFGIILVIGILTQLVALTMDV